MPRSRHSRPVLPALQGVVVACLVLGSVPARADETTVETNAADEVVSAPVPASAPATGGRSFDEFRLVTERNIFDPNRRPREMRRPEPERPPEPKVDIVAFTGTLSYAKGTFAFFDSNTSEYRKTARVGDEIAGFRVKGIDQSFVALERESQLLELKVGQQLRREAEGSWEVTSGERLQSGSSSARGSSRRSRTYSTTFTRNDGGSPDRSFASRDEEEMNPADDAGNEPDTSSEGSDEEGPSEVLKRLLEQRRKEQEQ